MYICTHGFEARNLQASHCLNHGLIYSISRVLILYYDIHSLTQVFNDSSAVSWAMAEQPLSKEDLERVAERLSRCLRDTFLSVDRSLIDLCKTRKLDYVSSTGVTALMWGNVLTIAHVGDSRACIARVVGDTVYPEWLTVDHKPNTPSELGRIVNCGGSLVWLHGSKPYIRYLYVIYISINTLSDS